VTNDGGPVTETTIQERAAPVAVGRLLRINVSGGGVPKRPVTAARVERLGVVGDGHNELGEHGGPLRAVSLFAVEAICRVAAEGHPIAPGGAGENFTTEGLELSLLPVGTVLEIGAAVRLELTGAAMPCRTIRHNFLEGRFGRLSIQTHPSDSRMYARVLVEGDVRAGDSIRVVPAPADAPAVRERLLHALGDAETSSALEMWRAAADAGFDVRIAEDGDYAAAASPDLPDGAFNKAYGLDWVPVLIPSALEHFRTAGATGWLEVREQPWVEAVPEMSIDHFGAAPDAIAPASIPEGVTIRRARRDEADAWDAVLASAGQFAPTRGRETAAWHAVTVARMASRKTEHFLAEADGRVVGAALLHVRHRGGWLRSAVVLPEYRRRGIHRALIAARVAAAVERGCDIVGGSAVPDSSSARSFRGLGFAHLARRGRYRVDGSAPAG
jgi:MOSC domain-containing protein YiiM/N-acetylglutamate synthase-like GNAT family acetyltransferase